MIRATGHVYIVKRKRGDHWYIKYRRPDGRQIQKKLGPAWIGNGRPPAGYFTSRTAEEALQAILTDLRRGIGASDATGATFADAATEYLRYVEHVRQIGTVTVKDYRGVINRYLIPAFGSKPIDTITPDMIDVYKENLITEDRLSNRVIVRHLTVLHGVFKRAGRVWGLERHPASADLVERPKVVYTGEYRAYEPEEVELLAAHAHDAQDAAIFRTAAYTGLRQGECLALRWRDVDFVTGLLHVRRNYTNREEKISKGRRVRSVPMTPHVVDTLARLKDRGYLTEDDDVVFSNTAGDYLCAWGLRRRYYKAVRAAGIRRLVFHDLRHTFGTHAVRKLDGYAVQSYMGHQHYSTTQRYLHHKPRREDAQKLADAFVSPTMSRTNTDPNELSATDSNQIRSSKPTTTNT
jgi:integrase